MPYSCSVCAGSINVHQHVRGGTCDSPRCRDTVLKRVLAQHAERERADRQALADPHAKALLKDTARAANARVLAITGTAASLVDMPPARREQFRERVTQEVTASAEPDTDTATVTAAVPPSVRNAAVLGAACATCRGFCCRMGGDTGYVDAATLRRLRMQRPELDSAALVSLYVDAIPARAVEHSCIYHGEQGCALPRDLRSHICNNYFCPPLREWIGQAEGVDASVVVAVILEDRKVIRAAVIGDESPALDART